MLTSTPVEAQQPQWPEIESEHKPWTRWWWQGSAVDKQNLTRELEKLKEANIGGVEITPIYGVAGYEDRFIDYLSPRWIDMLKHTLKEGERLNLGIDMATGTGWPFGGPWVDEDHTSKRLYFKRFPLKGGEQLSKSIQHTQQPYLRAIGNSVQNLDQLNTGSALPAGNDRLTIDELKQPIGQNEHLQYWALEQVRFEKELPLLAVVGYSADGRSIDLTDRVDQNGELHWTAPNGYWMVYAVFRGWHGKMVERAAPGGEGFAIDHFSNEALNHYLATFDSAFAGEDISSLRSFFNDSYEVDDAEGEANWTPGFFDKFEQQQGYDLRKHLPALLGGVVTEQKRRVLTDYRETISTLLLEEFTRRWDAWADKHDALIRNQAHGSPGNLLDLYGASDIPETEGTDILRAKMASSAANVTGKKRSSAEAATWLNEHFTSSLSDLKKAIDRYFISGINHVFYHGTAYSPSEERWPGWLFYAAVHFNDRNPFWDHFGAFNHYVARVQSFMQSGEPDNDILLYFPIQDQWATPGYGLLRHFEGGLGAPFDGTPFKQAAEQMVEQGYGFDFISDSQLARTGNDGRDLRTEGAATYRTIVVPKSEYIPLSTMRHLQALAESGATLIAYGGLPGKVPGLGDLQSRQQQLEQLNQQLEFNATDTGGVEEARVGNGRILRGENLDALLAHAGIQREKMADHELMFNRRSHSSGHHYFITNWGEETVDGWIALSREAESAAIFDPARDAAGYARVRQGSGGATELYLQLDPGESIIVKTYDGGVGGPKYRYTEAAGDPLPLQGQWTLSFRDGGPVLPDTVHLDHLKSWTDTGTGPVDHFSGTGVYELAFAAPGNSADGWILDLGTVKHSARVYLNGEDLGILNGPGSSLFIEGEQLQEQNTLKVEVSNLMANRIARLDQQEVNWKKFYNINFPARLGENRNRRGLFDASSWSPRASGLLGPVILQPVQVVE
ncbi:glycosyl hydrolase [Halalkalibaculum sp. DA384]|uniref:glycosyl hydrolase n=1 Tax=Halalkalibaculum sp. DA384 TaxID=3373606 RepID=UPI003754AAB6